MSQNHAVAILGGAMTRQKKRTQRPGGGAKRPGEVVVPVFIEPLRIVSQLRSEEQADSTSEWAVTRCLLESRLKDVFTARRIPDEVSPELIPDWLGIGYWLSGRGTESALAPVAATLNLDLPVWRRSHKELGELVNHLTSALQILDKANAVTRGQLDFAVGANEAAWTLLRDCKWIDPPKLALRHSDVEVYVRNALGCCESALDAVDERIKNSPSGRVLKTDKHILDAISYLDVAWSFHVGEEGTRDPGVSKQAEHQRQSRFFESVEAFMGVIQPANKREGSYADMVRKVVTGEHVASPVFVELSVPESEKDSIIAETVRRLKPELFIKNLRGQRDDLARTAPNDTEGLKQFDDAIVKALADTDALNRNE